jgi:hypothetical protein
MKYFFWFNTIGYIVDVKIEDGWRIHSLLYLSRVNSDPGWFKNK